MLSLDRATAREDAMTMGLIEVGDRQLWRCHTTVERYAGDIDYEVKGPGLLIPRAINTGEIVTPYDVTEVEGNILTIGGASVQWQTLIGNGTTTAGQALTYYNNANAHIGVGANSGTAAVDTQTDLQTTPTRKAMDATYPLHTDTTGTAGSKSITFRSTFATGDANIAWNEWGIFNASTGGRMLNRKVESLGTKTSAATRVLTITLSLA
jgi:hypothetical protein